MKKLLTLSLFALIVGIGTSVEAKANDKSAAVVVAGVETGAQVLEQTRYGRDRRWDDRRNDRRWNDRRWNDRRWNNSRPAVRYETRIVRRGNKVYRETYRVTYDRGRVKTKRVDRVRIR